MSFLAFLRDNLRWLAGGFLMRATSRRIGAGTLALAGALP